MFERSGALATLSDSPASDLPAESHERASRSRLEAVSSLYEGGAVSDYADGGMSRAKGWWLAHRLWGRITRIVEGTLSLHEAGSAIVPAAAIARFLDRHRPDVARLTVVGLAAGLHPAGGPRDEAFPGDYSYATRAIVHRDVLKLGKDADDLVARLGRHTRRNIRRTERIADELGMKFSFRLAPGMANADDGLRRLSLKNRPAPLTRKRFSRFEKLVSAKEQGFEARVEMESGELVSYCRGFIEGNVGYLVYQLNNPKIPRINLSLFNRINTIENLTALGIRELVFVFGCAGLLKAACEASPAEEWVVVRHHWRGVGIASVLSLILPRARFGKSIRRVMISMLRKAADQVKTALTFGPSPSATRSEMVLQSSIVALLVSCAAVGVRIPMQGILDESPYSTLYPAVVVATVWRGASAGLLTTILGVLGVVYYVVPPYDSFALNSGKDVCRLCIYLATALPMLIWIARRNAAKQRQQD